MKNITIAVPAEVYRRARVKAAERDTSVSALVRGFLISLAEGEPDFERRKRLQEEVIRSVRQFRAANRLKREDVYARGPRRKRAVR